jgi:hypothetical protein
LTQPHSWPREAYKDAQLPCLNQIAKNHGKFGFDQNMGEDLFLAHVCPDLAFEPPDPTILGKVVGIDPAPKGVDVRHPVRDDHLDIFVKERHCGSSFPRNGAGNISLEHNEPVRVRSSWTTLAPVDVAIWSAHFLMA